MYVKNLYSSFIGKYRNWSGLFLFIICFKYLFSSKLQKETTNVYVVAKITRVFVSLTKPIMKVIILTCTEWIKYTFGTLLIVKHGEAPLSYFSLQPVLHDWCNKGCGMSYPVCGMVHIKEPLLLINKNSLYGSSRFPFSLSEWSLTMSWRHITVDKMCWVLK